MNSEMGLKVRFKKKVIVHVSSRFSTLIDFFGNNSFFAT